MTQELQNQLVDPIGKRIVVAAAEHFTHVGYEGASTANIAAAARTSKREIYARFGNKEGLFKLVMAYVCSLAEDAEQETHDEQADSMSATLERIAHAVLTRFLLPETRGVLVAAIGASPKFPTIPQVFWNEGPGQAVAQIASLLSSTQAREIGIRVEQPDQVARRFILDCCGPFVLDVLFDARCRPERTELTDHVHDVTHRLIATYRVR